MPTAEVLLFSPAVCGSTAICPAGSCQKDRQRISRRSPAGNHASGRQSLAAARTARGDDAAAALGGHAGAETVAPLADELGWLIGALHLFDYRGVRPFLVLFGEQELVVRLAQRKKRRADGPNVRRLIETGSQEVNRGSAERVSPLDRLREGGRHEAVREIETGLKCG